MDDQKMAKKVVANVKLRVEAGKANPAPPVGSILGQYGVNMMDFINPFNERTREMTGMVTAHVTIYDDRSMKFNIKSEATDERIRRILNLEKGSGVPHTEKVGRLSRAQLEEIAKEKMGDMNTSDLQAAMKQVAGTARSMGVEVEWD